MLSFEYDTFSTISNIGIPRLDWFEFGVSSANRTAAFIACAIIASWEICAIKAKWSFWISLICTFILFFFLIQTHSRGAFISLILSVVILFSFSKIKLTKLRIFALVCFVIYGIFLSLSSVFSTRMANMLTLQSSSANCRAEIYLSGLKMLTDAPSGLAVENSPAEIYMCWYQNLDDSSNYVSMLNSHLEFLCQHGFFLRLGYLLFWSFIFFITFPFKRDTFNAVAFSTWFCFGLSACFSNVMNFWALWIIPVAILFIAIIYNRQRFLSWKFYSKIFITSLLAMSVIYLFSYLFPRNCKLNFLDNGDVIVGKNQSFLLFSPMEKTLGPKYGMELAEVSHNENIGGLVANDIQNKNSFDVILISDSKDISKLANIKSNKTVLLNCIANDELLDFIKDRNEKVIVVLGNMSNWSNRNIWIDFAKTNKNIELKILTGVADYIPDWTIFLKNETN